MSNFLLNLIVLRSANPEATRAFYATLGFDFRSEQHGTGPIHLSSENGDFVLEIYPATSNAEFDAKAGGATMLGFRVESLDAVLEALQGQGIAPKSAPKNADWGRFANVLDPDGRAIQLCERISDTKHPKFQRPKGTVVYTHEEERQILEHAYTEMDQNPEFRRALLRKAGIIDENGEFTPKHRD